MTAPLVLLPIRIETAFFDRQLVIRVYPDEPHLDRRAPSPPPGESRPRAPVRPRWLPDRWIATGWRDGARVFLVEGSPIDAEHLAVAPDLSVADSDREMRWLVDIGEAERVGMALRVTLDVPRLDRLLVFGIRAGSSANEFVELLEAHHATDGLAFVAPGTATNQTAAETAEPAPVAGADADRAGARAAAALGAPGASSLLQCTGADRDEETIARAMATAVWSGTWGYFLSSMMSPVALAPEQLDQTRSHFIRFVRAGGALPTLRIGAQPYALLATTSLDRWRADASDLAGLVGLLARLRPLWREAATQSDVGAALLDAMRVAPRSHGFEARTLLGRRFVANLFEYFDTPDLARWNAQQEQLGTAALARIGLDWKPRIAHAVFDGDSFRLRTPLVAPLQKSGGRLVEAVRSSVNYLAWLRDATVEDLRAQLKIPRRAPPLVASDGSPTGHRSSVDASADESNAFYSILRHSTLRAYADAAARAIRARSPSPWPGEIEPELAGHPWSSGESPTIWQLFADHLPRDHRNPAPTIGEWLHAAIRPETAALTEHRASLGTLATQPLAALERHFAGVIDLCAYRLDAWITSVATRRLDSLRAADPQALQIGAYGWVEHLVPRNATAASEGFILAPSLAQATTAAILRSGFRSRRLAGNTDNALAIDLSSERARNALRVLDGVRSGLRLAEQLGAMLERSLHDAGLDRFIARFRRFAPADQGAIVDGETLLEKWRPTRDLAGFDWDGERDAVAAHLDRLADTLDAIGDLSLAEGVYQAVRGNTEGASAIFDAVGRGEQPPPETSVMATPPRAVRHTARLLIGLAPREAPAARWAIGAHAIRGRLSPELDAWADHLLGDPRKVRCHASWRDGSGAEVARRELQLAQLGLSALDIVYLAGELETWLVELAQRERPTSISADATVVIDRVRVDDNATLDEVLAIARGIRAVLDAARPARAEDFAVGAESTADTAALAVARQARDELQERIDAAIASTSADSLRAISAFGIAGSDREDTIAIARARVASARTATDAATMFGAVFGTSFPAPAITELPAAARESLTARRDRDSDGTADWISAIGRVRAAAGRLDDLLLVAQALGRSGRFELAQVPDEPGLPPLFAPAAKASGPRLVLAVHAPERLGERVAALVVDEWVESLPADEQTGGIGFHFDRPGSEPPQAILLAVPPDLGAPWTPDSIESVLHETLDLAAIRSVAPESLGAIAQIVPATVFAFNAAGETISTDFTPLADG